ncbi:hypothetical protein NQ315_011863 [Exocentrus adspersus]|uniref:Lipase domain-containing protein n=1 Tax=Exocentrus adspersus TaxID=1586481 RepID=A0AAV8W1S8_9CUCU|nr:hypothetical protein NQ315_011863 [Exocentrus adspersus]
MKIYILLLAVFPETIFGAVLPEQSPSTPKYLLVRKPDGRFEIESLLQPEERRLVASEEDVNFYLYTRNNPETFTLFTSSNLTFSTVFDASKPTLFIIHGWQNNYSSPVNKLIKEAVLEKHDVNVFVTDWGAVAKENYVAAFYSVPSIGKYVGKFITKLVSLYKYPPGNIKVVGHSLGAHVAGVAGKHTNGSLDYIVGLDPAGPLFSIRNVNNRLDKRDARYVQVIHTCTKILGLNHSIGDADYYPNGGISQTGCAALEDLDGSCSHSMSYEYYAESIRQRNSFIATNCESYDKYEKGSCEHNMKSKMGGYFVNKT